MNGLECAKEIVRMDLSVKVVFATGYSQFAVQAFDLEAFDYILKPYDEARIARTISRLADSLALIGKGTGAGRDRLHLTKDLPPDAGQDHHDLSRARDRPDL